MFNFLKLFKKKKAVCAVVEQVADEAANKVLSLKFDDFYKKIRSCKTEKCITDIKANFFASLTEQEKKILTPNADLIKKQFETICKLEKLYKAEKNKNSKKKS